MVMPETARESGCETALNRLRQVVSDARLAPQAPHLRVSFSAGAAVHRPGERWETTLARADALLYRSKEAGRNQCRFALT